MFLHRGHLLEVHIVKTVEDFILQVEFVKTHLSNPFLLFYSFIPVCAAPISSPKSVAGVQPVMRTRT